MPQLPLKEIPVCLKILKRKVWFSSEHQWKQLKDFQFKRDGNNPRFSELIAKKSSGLTRSR